MCCHPYSGCCVFRVLLPLLEHDSIPVRIAVVTDLSDILQPVKDQQDQLQPVFTCLLWADVNCAGQWRIQQQMLLQYARLCTLFEDAEVRLSALERLPYVLSGARVYWQSHDSEYVSTWC